MFSVAILRVVSSCFSTLLRSPYDSEKDYLLEGVQCQ